jgi:hypothetical protein
MSSDRNEHGYLPNFQLRHHHSGAIVCFTRLYTSKQLRKLMGVKKADWIRFVGRGHVPECDTYVNGKKLWTDTTLAEILKQYVDPPAAPIA